MIGTPFFRAGSTKTYDARGAILRHVHHYEHSQTFEYIGERLDARFALANDGDVQPDATLQYPADIREVQSVLGETRQALGFVPGISVGLIYCSN